MNLHEFALGGGAPNGFSSLDGQTRNPHDPTRGPAGSSGGTGAGIAAAFAQFGLGTDTGGPMAPSVPLRYQLMRGQRVGFISGVHFGDGCLSHLEVFGDADE